MLSRATLLPATFALAIALPVAASAQGVPAGEQAEWAQNYDGASRIRVQRSSTPILSAQALAATEETVERYRDIVSRGGWGTLQAPATLRVGARSPAVVALRQRLIMTGDLDPAAGSSEVYDSYVEAGV
jgi:murein L,D-transpeptidase YcbB/YkuD